MRFVKGVIDSADLPLNVSRELLQESRDVKAIREGNTRRVLSMLEDLAKKQKTAPESQEGKIDVGSGDAVPAPEPTEALSAEVTDVVDKTATAADAGPQRQVFTRNLRQSRGRQQIGDIRIHAGDEHLHHRRACHHGVKNHRDGGRDDDRERGGGGFGSGDGNGGRGVCRGDRGIA